MSLDMREVDGVIRSLPDSQIKRLLTDLRASVAELEAERETLTRSLSAAKQVIAAKEQASALYDKQLASLREARETLDSERAANAILTAENTRLWAWHDAVMAQPTRFFPIDDYTNIGLTIRPQPLTKGK